ncbi:MAG: hypothetical protein ACRECH_02550 [Nitrososphaerales archaeon]
MAKNKDDVCFCEDCKHQKATECLETFLCKCCERADRIRFEHPVFDEEGELSEEEKARREREAQNEAEEESKRQQEAYFKGVIAFE